MAAGRERKVYVHVRRRANRENPGGFVEKIAATRMIARHFSPETRGQIRNIMILGFGKSGRDLMESLTRDAGEDESWDIRVVDIQDRESDVMRENQRIAFVNINALVEKGITVLPCVYEPAKPADLKWLTDEAECAWPWHER